jgi:flagellar biogenesis protein FliO
MGAVLFWLGVGLVITLVLLAAWAVDRRARRMGHHVRHGSDILSETWNTAATSI